MRASETRVLGGGVENGPSFGMRYRSGSTPGPGVFGYNVSAQRLIERWHRANTDVE